MADIGPEIDAKTLSDDFLLTKRDDACLRQAGLSAQHLSDLLLSGIADHGLSLLFNSKWLGGKAIDRGYYHAVIEQY
jgi:hypothetical protein